MALTISYNGHGAGLNPTHSVGTISRIMTGTIDFDDSYPTGGESFDPSVYFPRGLLGVIFEPKGGYVFEYDYTNARVKAMCSNYDQAADGALTEVANGTNLSAVTGVRFIAWGY